MSTEDSKHVGTTGKINGITKVLLWLPCCLLVITSNNCRCYLCITTAIVIMMWRKRRYVVFEMVWGFVVYLWLSFVFWLHIPSCLFSPSLYFRCCGPMAFFCAGSSNVSKKKDEHSPSLKGGCTWNTLGCSFDSSKMRFLVFAHGGVRGGPWLMGKYSLGDF